MSDNQNSGEKTEKPTPKRLRDARKRGDVPKSKDVTSTLTLAFLLALIWLTWGYSVDKLAALTIDVLSLSSTAFSIALPTLGTEALHTFLSLSALVLLPVSAFGLLVDFLQTGPVFTAEKIKPQLDKLNPASGIKRMFSMDNLIELVKSLARTAVLSLIGYLVVRATLDQLVLLPTATPMHVVAALGHLTLLMMLWTLGIFLAITLLDAAYQHYAFSKKMKMSRSDIKQEHKNTEGDPHVKNERKQLHKEWGNQGAVQSASSATVLVVNPTHVAIAIEYDKDETPVPTVTAKGEDDLAREMREAAAKNYIPVVRNERLARTLLADVDEGDLIPRGLFDVVAEVILWATRTADRVAEERGEKAVEFNPDPIPAAPGEDLTRYPPSLSNPDDASLPELTPT